MHEDGYILICFTQTCNVVSHQGNSGGVVSLQKSFDMLNQALLGYWYPFDILNLELEAVHCVQVRIHFDIHGVACQCLAVNLYRAQLSIVLQVFLEY